MAENIYTRLCKAQSEFPNIVKDRKANAFRGGGGYKYADISSILSAIMPIMNKNGLSLIQKTTGTQNTVSVETVIFSLEGESISSGAFTVSTEGLNQKGVQAHGSAVTYARRYSLAAFLGLAYDDDDDGMAATRHYYEEPKKVQRPAPVAKNVETEGTKEENETFNTLKTMTVQAETAEELSKVTDLMKMKPKLTENQLNEIRAMWKRKKDYLENKEVNEMNEATLEANHSDAGDRD